MRTWLAFLLMPVLPVLFACSGPVNEPYPATERGQSILYTAFSERPKHLDPARSYSSNEMPFVAQIYEPPLQYHYLKRPYTLVPLTATELPRPRFFDRAGRPLPDDAPSEAIAESVYEVRIRPGIRYQPHPAFAVDAAGRPRYIPMPPGLPGRIRAVPDFPETGSRELVAADYVYQIKRLSDPAVNSPIYGLMASHIVGLSELRAALKRARAGLAEGEWLDLRRFDLKGAEVVDRYTYRIRIRGRYPQFIYWLAMPFFAPMPWEAEAFYAQPGMRARNLQLDGWPVGTGPYMLAEYQPNRRIRLVRNPNFRGEPYPSEGEAGDAAVGLLSDAGKPMPFIDAIVFSLETETIPYWNKFMQGYYDASGIGSDNFDQVIQVGADGRPRLSERMRARGVELKTSVAASLWYMGFNMLDPVVGGLDARARKLRQAISIAIDMEEFIAIFRNGRGIPAHGPIPPGLFGHVAGHAGINPVVYDWVDGAPRRRPIEVARRLLAEAGYPDGRDAQTGKPLVLFLDTAARGPDDKARLDWYRKQFRKLGVELQIRSTDYNRFQDKMRQGTAQIFEWGWNADYPDPENFLFLLHGPQRKAGQGGENAANYANPEYDRLFARMKDMDDGPERQAVINAMVDILRKDSPWVFGFYPLNYALHHAWYGNVKPNLMANNELKYRRIEATLRERARAEWNRPVWFAPILVVFILLVGLVPAWLSWRRKERASAR